MVSRPESGAGSVATRPLVCMLAASVGMVFLLIGILGFIPGITTNYGEMVFAGHDSGAMLFGVFQVSVLHNFFHILFGLVGLAFSRTVPQARAYLIGGGAIYLVLWLYGLVVGQDAAANIVPLNSPDDWLHFILGLGMIALGFATTRSHRAATPG